jgi:Leucine-rich repeat (LRR) protein
MQTGEEESQVFLCKEANCGRMFKDAEHYQRHLRQRHNKTEMSEERSTVAQSMTTEMNELNQLAASVDTLAHNIKDLPVTDDAIYLRSLLEVEMENKKKNKKSSITFEALQEAQELLTEEFIIEKAQLSPENEMVQSLELIEVLNLSNLGLCFFDKTGHFCPDRLQELKVLDFSNNKLLKVNGLSYLFNIETLDLSKNCISSLEGLEECTTLKSLNCSDNFIESCTELRALKKLKHLDLGDNKLKSIDEVILVIQDLPKLKELTLKGNSVDKA